MKFIAFGVIAVVLVMGISTACTDGAPVDGSPNSTPRVSLSSNHALVYAAPT
jgi:hypothetical protein